MLFLFLVVCVSASHSNSTRELLTPEQSTIKYYIPEYKGESGPFGAKFHFFTDEVAIEAGIAPKIMTEQEILKKQWNELERIVVKDIVETTNPPPIAMLYPLNDFGNVILQRIDAALRNVWNLPVAVVLEDNKDVHRDAEIFMNRLLNLSSVKTEFWVMKFNSSGVTSVLARTLTDRPLFDKLLVWDKSEIGNTYTFLGPQITKGGVAFFAILKAARLLPKDSAIIIFTNRRIEDEDLAQLSMKEVLEKRIRLYVIWGGLYPGLRNEERLLKEAAITSGGQFYATNHEKKLSKQYSSVYLQTPDATKTKAITTLRKDIVGPNELYFPIDTDVTGVHVSLTAPITVAVLNSPKGVVIDILNNSQVERFSPGSFSAHEAMCGLYEIQLNTARQTARTPYVGVWRLTTDGVRKSAHGYNITISVQTDFNVLAQVVEETYPKDNEKLLRLQLTGEFKNIDNITFIDGSGVVFKKRVPFTLKNKYKLDEHITALGKLEKVKNAEIDVKLNESSEPFFVQVSGKDVNGKPFSRISYISNDNNQNFLPPITVEMGADSELLVGPHQQAKLYFEVTNNRDQVVYLYFMCQDELSLLSRMEPLGAWLNPKQTTIVTVTTYVRNVVGSASKNLITFTASGPDKVRKSATMHISSNHNVDEEIPYMWHRYTSDCMNVILGNCRDGTWNIEVSVQDKDSGLLQVTSSPRGLYFPYGYSSGTREVVVGHYSGSCCQPYLQLTAVDLRNNRRSYAADAYYSTLNPASIAAIVLGLLLLILIIALIVFFCRRRLKKKGSMELPTYRGPQATGSAQRAR